MRRYLGLHRDNLVDAVRRLRRQPFATLLTVLVIAIALALPAGLRVLVGNLGSLSGGWQSAADFTVYFKLEVPTDRARALAREIAARPDVASVQFVDRASALEDFRAHSGFGSSLDALEGNPLPDALVIHPTSGAAGDVEGVAAAIRSCPRPTSCSSTPNGSRACARCSRSRRGSSTLPPCCSRSRSRS